jgi:hypothetical protein
MFPDATRTKVTVDALDMAGKSIKKKSKYEALKREGMPKSRAAAISNAGKSASRKARRIGFAPRLFGLEVAPWTQRARVGNPLPDDTLDLRQNRVLRIVLVGGEGGLAVRGHDSTLRRYRAAGNRRGNFSTEEFRTSDFALQTFQRRSISDSGDSAGPASTSPLGLNREPWHGQSHVRSAVFHATSQPRCVHVAERTIAAPASSR